MLIRVPMVCALVLMASACAEHVTGGSTVVFQGDDDCDGVGSGRCEVTEHGGDGVERFYVDDECDGVPDALCFVLNTVQGARVSGTDHDCDGVFDYDCRRSTEHADASQLIEQDVDCDGVIDACEARAGSSAGRWQRVDDGCDGSFDRCYYAESSGGRDFHAEDTNCDDALDADCISFEIALGHVVLYSRDDECDGVLEESIVESAIDRERTVVGTDTDFDGVPDIHCAVYISLGPGHSLEGSDDTCDGAPERNCVVRQTDAQGATIRGDDHDCDGTSDAECTHLRSGTSGLGGLSGLVDGGSVDHDCDGTLDSCSIVTRR